MRIMVLMLALGLAQAAAAFAGKAGGKRVKKNKYAQFSKAEEVRQSLRFSNIDEDTAPSVVTADAAAEPAARNRSLWTYPDAALVDQRDPSTFGFTEIGVVLGAHGTRGELKVLSDSDFARERLCEPGLTWLRRPRRRAPREMSLVHGRKGPGSNNWLVTLADVATREQAAALKGARFFVRRELRPALADDEMMLWELEGLSVARAERAADGVDAGSTDTDTADGADDGTEGVSWRRGEHVGVIIGVIPREELTGNPQLGNDLLEIALGRTGSGGDGGGGGIERGADGGETDGVDANNGNDADADEEYDDADVDTVLVPFVPQIVVDVNLNEGLILLDPPEGLLDILQPRRQERVVIRGLIPAQAESLRAQRAGAAAERDKGGDPTE